MGLSNEELYTTVANSAYEARNARFRRAYVSSVVDVLQQFAPSLVVRAMVLRDLRITEEEVADAEKQRT